jgi:hypothetical protein
MGSEWWKRRWTVQEVVLPLKVIVVLGSVSISWDTLLSAAEVLLAGSYYLPYDTKLHLVFDGIRFTALS